MVVAIWVFAAERGNPKNFALVELFDGITLFEDFDFEIFPAVFANRFVDMDVSVLVLIDSSF